MAAGQNGRCPFALHRREERLGNLFGAGHWIQQEQPDRLGALLLAFAQEVGATDHIRGYS